MTNKINENHSLSNILNKQSKKSLEITPLSLKYSREIFAMHINDCFRISNEDALLLENMGIHAIENYDYLYSKNISLILRRYVYNVLCTNEVYYGKKNTIVLEMVGEPRIKHLAYTRSSHEFLDSCFHVLKERMSDLGFRDESINKTLKKYLYGQATPIGSNLKTKIAFYLGLHIDNLNYILDSLEISKQPTSVKEELALHFIEELSNQPNPDYNAAYKEFLTIEFPSIPNKVYLSNNVDFIEQVDALMHHQSLDAMLSELGVELDRVVRKKKADDEMDLIEDEWSQYLIEFRNDLLDDSTIRNIKKNNISVKKRHVELLFFYDCLMHHEEYFKHGTLREIMKYFVGPMNQLLEKYGLASFDYGSYFDKFLVLCLLKQNPANLFNQVLTNAKYLERGK